MITWNIQIWAEPEREVMYRYEAVFSNTVLFRSYNNAYYHRNTWIQVYSYKDLVYKYTMYWLTDLDN